ncbi:lytic polysaccharide monooxygenase [Streptomyces sp. ID05-04B]|uniref:lytic polysaccharide monooxygenase auxiliary activity family 9 protein n=1 Tax=Streptomyces sp. ID05-04B TaxID=3028661 RepID=UPI0029C239D8|nr:lytic polysaccharide monooxygenase [Streptomyces sp. ID05-04B]MDX5566995.1 lytic polysaccharide monooxygenase [Streptomyces sp. ID05-04B]
MPARRKAVAAVALGLIAPALAALSTVPAAAHGSMGDPVSRVAQCYAEGPESPRSAACRAAVATGGTQALYDWNGIRIGDADGRHQELIPDGRLCSAGNEEFKGLDLARADWPATAVHSGPYTFAYRVTAPHRGTFTVYLTKAGYDPARPLAWSDLDLAHPVAAAADPVAVGGFSTFSGTLPERSGRQLLYAVWQRSDSPEAFYSCSDVTFPGAGSGTGTGTGPGKGSGTGDGAAPAASAPSEEQIQDGADRSTVEHHGHGDDDAATTTDPAAPGTPSADGDAIGGDAHGGGAGGGGAGGGGAGGSANAPQAAGVRAGPGGGLAHTGGDGSTSYLAVGGAAALALGAALLFASVRRRANSAGRHGR